MVESDDDDDLNKVLRDARERALVRQVRRWSGLFRFLCTLQWQDPATQVRMMAMVDRLGLCPALNLTGEDWGFSDAWEYRVYRIYDAQKRLLYVGATKDFDARMKKHKRRKEWWHMVAHVEVTVYSDQWIAEFEERQAIRNEHPLFNKVRYHTLASYD